MATADRSNWTRLVVMALGIALCAIALLGVATIDPLFKSILARNYASQPSSTGAGPEFHFQRISNPVNGQSVSGTLLLGPSDAAPPPGVGVCPGAGELVVSPALAAALDDPGNTDLRELVPGRITGEIDASVLIAPQDWTYYQGVAALPDDAQSATGWGVFYGEADDASVLGSNPQLLAILITGVAVLMIPLLLFTAMAGRIGAAHRDRRSATLRLLGASTSQLRWIVAAEVALASGAGLTLAALGYLALRALAPFISIGGWGAQSADIHPHVTATVWIVVAVPVLAAVSALTGSRQAAIDPLGAHRRPVRRPTMWWRLVLLAVTTAATVYLLHGSRLADGSLIGGTVGLCGVIVLTILCVAALVGPLTHVVAVAFTGGGPAVSLARGRLLRQSGLSTRPAAAVSTVLASVIALMSVLSLRPDIDPATGNEIARPYVGHVNNLSVADWQRAYADLRAVDGVSTVEMIGRLPMSSPRSDAQIATCDSIRWLTDTGTACADGDVFGQIQVPNPAAIDRFSIDGTTATWMPPADSRNTYVDIGDNPDPRNGYLVTPSVVATQMPNIGPIPYVSVAVQMPSTSLPAAREAIAWLGPDSAALLSFDEYGTGSTSTYSWVRVVLLGAAAFVLLICALAQWLLAAEYVNERRRAFALARASGVPLATMTRSVVIGALFPVLIGSVVATGVGALVAWEIISTRGNGIATLNVAWLGISCAATILVSLLVALGTAAQLRRTTGPAALRTE